MADQPMAPAEPHSAMLSLKQEAVIVAFRRHTQRAGRLTYALQPSIPGLTRFSLHRCVQRHGISKLPDLEGDKPSKRKFRASSIGYFHVDITDVRTCEGKLYLFVAISRASKFAVAWRHSEANQPTACQFLGQLLQVVPYRSATLLTGNGIHFAST